MAPSGVQKERMQPEDMFVLDATGAVVEEPAPLSGKPLKLSECAPLFMSAYELRGAGAVIHSHSVHSVLATLLDPSSSEFRATNLEMIKGIVGHTYFGGCVVPIIENTARECELTERLRAAIELYPSANAVLVRRHGVYVWGEDWIKAKTQAECYDYLFEAAVKMHQLGINASVAPKSIIDPDDIIRWSKLRHANGASNGEGTAGPAKRARTSTVDGKAVKAVVLDIEGTIAPVRFVTEVLFPYARDHVRDHLEAMFDTAETQEDVARLRARAYADVREGVAGAVPIPAGPKAAIVDACVANVLAMMAVDRKDTALKTFQGHVWREGYRSGKLVGSLYPDVGPKIQALHAQGTKVYIYSSGSREAQRMLMAFSNSGDLRPFISGFFDTTVGPKTTASSYSDIALTLGLDSPHQILFATDSVKEVAAAREAGWQVLFAVRDDASVPEGLGGVDVITSLDQLPL